MLLRRKSQIPLRYPGRRQVRSWSQTGPKLVADARARASRTATSSGHVCDQDSGMESGLNDENNY